MTFLRATLLFLVVSVLPLHAGGKKDDAAGIAFHLETDPGNNPKMIFSQFVAGQERVFHRVPEISTRDIAAFNPFPAQNGDGYGVLLQLTKRSANRFSAVTAANIGRWMIARVNGRIVDGVVIDQQINDGEVVIWKGLSLAEVKGLDKTTPRIGEKKPRG